MIVQFLGGPHDGLVCDVTRGDVPVVVVGEPRARTLLDHPLRPVKWNEAHGWYEATIFPVTGGSVSFSREVT